NENNAIKDDVYRLPLTIWRPKGRPQAIVLALHGFNDYRNAFAGLGPRFAASRFLIYAYDQRGFGETAQRGIWPGTERIVADAKAMVRLICRKHHNLPLFLLGDSMGGAVVLTMAQDLNGACVSGAILLAPAVWGWQTMAIWQQFALWLAAHVAPAHVVTGKGLNITASDNVEMLKALGSDPLVIKESRIDTIFGLTDLMETALLAGSQWTTPALILYGEKDEIIPARPICQMLDRLPAPPTGRWRLALYPDGYHMLMRDLQAEVVITDMLSWLQNGNSVLPSGLEVKKDTSRVRLLCEQKTKPRYFDY
ncbi:MAG: lysophospholipase, partial [Gammaproteobacteria bacterium]